MDSQAWDRRYGGRDLVWSAEPNRFVVAELATNAPGRALDLGCGEGRNAIWLAERGWEVTGVDFSEVALAKAHGLAAARGVRARWVNADLLVYRPEPEAFDLVLLAYLQLPAVDRRAVVQAAAAAVAPGGTLLIVGHDSSNLDRGYGGPADPALLYTAGDLAADLESTGVHLVRADRLERPVAIPGGERIALDVLVRARRPPRTETGALAADALVLPWFTCLRDALHETDIRLFDGHTHLGCADPDGSCFELDELRGALELLDGRGVVFPLAEPGSYQTANDWMVEAAARSEGRLVPFCRVDPGNGALREAERAVARGARGIKLHPRAERFSLREPAVEQLFAFAGERRLPILIHAGRGIPSLGHDALQLARTHPDTPVILAHAAIADLAWIWPEAASRPNLLFDTAWWNMADQLALFGLIPAGQIVFASDAPYGRPVAAAAVALRAALAAGLTPAQVASVAGGQLERLLAGSELADLGPAPATPARTPGPLLERVHTLLVAAAARLAAGYPPGEYLELARLACELPADHPDGAAAGSVRELIDRYGAHVATDPPRRGPRTPGVHLIFVAAAVARTPWLPLPPPQP